MEPSGLHILFLMQLTLQGIKIKKCDIKFIYPSWRKNSYIFCMARTMGEFLKQINDARLKHSWRGE